MHNDPILLQANTNVQDLNSKFDSVAIDVSPYGCFDIPSYLAYFLLYHVVLDVSATSTSSLDPLYIYYVGFNYSQI